MLAPNLIDLRLCRRPPAAQVVELVGPRPRLSLAVQHQAGERYDSQKRSPLWAVQWG